MFFAALAALGATAGVNLPFLKQKFGPVVPAALGWVRSAVNDSCMEVAERVAKRPRLYGT